MAYTLNTNLLIVLHNFQNYDSHLIVRGLKHYGGDIDKVKVIGKSKEKFTSLQVGQLKFIDSFAFMSASLESLAANLRTFPFTDEIFSDRCDELVASLKRKGVYPYEHVKDWSVFGETALPPVHAFSSSLKGGITSGDYEHAQRMWKLAQCRTFGDYHDLYLWTDVALLSDVFENFRTMALTDYKLDPAHYISTPGLSWDAAMKSTRTSLELLTDIDMHLFVEAGI